MAEQSGPFSLLAPLPEEFNITHVVFDFDGTLSWLRHGWPDIMADLFLELVLRESTGEASELRGFLLDQILSLNGKPTIFQTTWFSLWFRERTGIALDAENLRAEYQARLDRAIAERTALIRGGKAKVDEFVVWQARPLLEKLRREGYKLFVLSSTVEQRVREEAELLQLTSYFAAIHGGRGDPTQFSKRAVFERLLHEESITGANLLSFGDGPVELRDTRELGGVAIGICSDEAHNGSGVLDPFKERQLSDAGAHITLADFSRAPQLMDYLRSLAR